MYIIENIGVMGEAWAGLGLGGQGGGGKIHCPEHQMGGGEIEVAGVHDTADFGTIQSEVAPVHGHAKPRDAGEAAGSCHIMEAGAGAEMMAAAGAPSNGRAVAVVAVGKSVAAETDNQVRVH
jgi:hypothetical protein